MSAIIYNVTVKVTWPIHDAWLHWMKTEHIADVMKTGCFTSYSFARLLEIDEDEGPTYSCQYTATNMDQYKNYIVTHSQTLRKKGEDLWSNQFIAFRSIMQIVN